MEFMPPFTTICMQRGSLYSCMLYVHRWPKPAIASYRFYIRPASFHKLPLFWLKTGLSLKTKQRGGSIQMVLQPRDDIVHGQNLWDKWGTWEGEAWLLVKIREARMICICRSERRHVHNQSVPDLTSEPQDRPAGYKVPAISWCQSLCQILGEDKPSTQTNLDLIDQVLLKRNLPG